MISAPARDRVSSWERGVSEETLPRRSWFGPDSDYLAIVLCDGLDRVRLESWQELFETDENVVATSSGLRTLGGQSRSEILTEQPNDYRRFRETWTLIREASRQLIPDEEEPAESPHFAVRQ